MLKFILLRLCQANVGHSVASSEVLEAFVVDEFHQRFVAELILGLQHRVANEEHAGGYNGEVNYGAHQGDSYR